MDDRRLIAVTGAGGLIGSRLLETLPSRYEPIRLNRSRPSEWASRLEGVHGVVHLAGEPIAARRWTAVRKQALRDSRVLMTRALVDAIAACRRKPRVFLSASAVGFYGDRGDEKLDESSPAGSGFLAGLCADWEKEAVRAEEWGVRTVLLRTGIVLDRRGGALAKMIPPFLFFAGGPLGSGRQFMSWIHAQDEVGAIRFCLENEAMRGPVNLTAPAPVRMREFVQTLGRTMNRPSILPAPSFALKLLLGEMAQELLLSSQNAAPTALLRAGFKFRFPRLDDALADALR